MLTAYDCSAYITACNPLGRELDARENEQKTAALMALLQRSGFSFVRGVGEDPSHQGVGEASFLVLGQSLSDARELGSELEQNPIVWSGFDATPRLFLLR